MQCNAMQYNTMQCNAMQYNAMQYNAMQCNTILCNAIQYNAMQCNTIICIVSMCDLSPQEMVASLGLGTMSVIFAWVQKTQKSPAS